MRRCDYVSCLTSPGRTMFMRDSQQISGPCNCSRYSSTTDASVTLSANLQSCCAEVLSQDMQPANLVVRRLKVKCFIHHKSSAKIEARRPQENAANQAGTLTSRDLLHPRHSARPELHHNTSQHNRLSFIHARTTSFTCAQAVIFCA